MLDRRHVQWLRAQLPGLVGEGVLDESTADRLREKYPEPEGVGSQVVTVALGAIGAAFIGGGIILLLAHNWDELTRPVRTVLSLAPVLISIAAAGWVLYREKSATWREPVALLWGLSLAASLSLIDQTYHLAGDPQDQLKTWLILGVPVFVLLRSVSAASLYCLGLVSWVFTVAGPGRESYQFWVLWSLAAGFAVWRMRGSRERAGDELLIWAVVLTLCFGIPASFESTAEAFWGPVFAGLFAGLFAVGRLVTGSRRRRPLLVVGCLGWLGLAFGLSFDDTWGEQVRALARLGEHDRWTWDQIVPIALVVLPSLAIVAAATRRLDRESLVLSAGGVLAWVGLAIAYWGSTDAAALLVSAYLLGVGAVCLARGFRDESLLWANLGTAVLGLLVLIRFFDTEWSFVARGIAFIVVGVGLVTVNVVVVRRRRRR